MGLPRSWCWAALNDPWCYATSREHRRYDSSLSTWRLGGMWLNQCQTYTWNRSDPDFENVKNHSKTIQSHEPPQ